MAFGNSYGYHSSSDPSEPNPGRAPLPISSDYSPYPYPQQSRVLKHPRSEDTTQEQQTQLWSYNNASTLYKPAQQAQVYQSQSGGGNSSVTTAALVAPRIISTELGAVDVNTTPRLAVMARPTQRHSSTAGGVGEYGQRYPSRGLMDDRQTSMVALAVSNYQTQPYQQQQQQQQQQSQPSQVNQLTHRQQPSSHVQYIQEHTRPEAYNPGFAIRAAQTSPTYHKPPSPQTSQPLIWQQSVERQRAQPQQRPSAGKTYQQTYRQQPQIGQNYQYTSRGSVAVEGMQSAYQTTTTSSVTASDRHFTSPTPSVSRQQVRTYAIEQPQVTGIGQLSSREQPWGSHPPQAGDEDMPHAQHQDTQHGRHRRWITPPTRAVSVHGPTQQLPAAPQQHQYQQHIESLKPPPRQAPKAHHHYRQQQQNPHRQMNYSAPMLPESDGGDPVDRGLMEKRMRELVETMKFYQSKDPSTFHAAWESVRKEDSSKQPAIAITPDEPNQSTSVESLAMSRARAVQLQQLDEQTGDSGLQDHWNPNQAPYAMNTPAPLHVPKTAPKRQLQTNPSASAPFSAPARPHPVQARPQPPREQMNEFRDDPKVLTPAPTGVPSANLLQARQQRQQTPTPAMRQIDHPLSLPPLQPQFAQQRPLTVPSGRPCGMSDPQRTIVAVSAAEFLSRSSGKPISHGYISGFLEHTNNFVTMCEHFESLGHVYDRGGLAKVLLEAVQSTGTSIHPGSAPAPAAPTTLTVAGDQNAKISGRVLGEVEDHQEQILRESNLASHSISPRPAVSAEHTLQQQAAHGATPVQAQVAGELTATPFHSMKSQGERPRKDGGLPGSVPKVNSNPAFAPQNITPMHNSGSSFSVLPGANGYPLAVSIASTRPIPAPVITNRFPSQGASQRPLLGHFSTVALGHNNFPTKDFPSSPAPFQAFEDVRDSNNAPIYMQDACDMEIDIVSPSAKQPNTLELISTRTAPGANEQTTPARQGTLPAMAPYNDISTPSGSLIDTMVTRDSSIVPASERAPRMARKSKQPLATTIQKKNAARVSRYSPIDIARTILIINRKHPNERPLNSHLLALRQNLPGQIDWNSDLATVRWDILDPDPITVDNDDTDGGDEGGSAVHVPGRKDEATPAPNRKRADGQALVSHTNSKAAPSTSSEPCWNGNLHKTTNETTLPIVITSRSPSPKAATMDAAPSSKRRRINQPAAVRRQVNGDGSPTFKKYHCEWKDCNVDLHNLDTLRKHLLKVHKRKNDSYGGFPCNWVGCLRPPTTEQIHALKGRRDKLQPMVWDFSSEEDWEDHINGHLDSVMQSMGFGPATIMSEQDPGTSDIDYLSDHLGQLVTPVAKPSTRTHMFIPPPGFKPTRQFNIAHNINAQSRKSSSYMRALERARLLGAGMEGDEVGNLLDSAGLNIYVRRVVPANWPPKK